MRYLQSEMDTFCVTVLSVSADFNGCHYTFFINFHNHRCVLYLVLLGLAIGPQSL